MAKQKEWVTSVNENSYDESSSGSNPHPSADGQNPSNIPRHLTLILWEMTQSFRLLRLSSQDDTERAPLAVEFV